MSCILMLNNFEIIVHGNITYFLIAYMASFLTHKATKRMQNSLAKAVIQLF